MASWEEWVQQVGGDVVNKWATKEYAQPNQQMQLGALGQNGYYVEGTPGVVRTPNSVTQPGGMTTPVMLGLGVALLLVAVLVLKD